jgi:hypothetical protein
MAQRDDLLKGAALGLGAALLIPVVFTALAPMIRPLARSAMRAGILAYEKGREAVEEFGEVVDDLVAEVEEELVSARESEDASDAIDEEASVATRQSTAG